MMQDPSHDDARLALAFDHIASLQNALEDALAQGNDAKQPPLRQAFADQTRHLQKRLAEQDRALHAAAVELALVKTQLANDIAVLAAQNHKAALDLAERQRLQAALQQAQREAAAWKHAATQHRAGAETARDAAQKIATEAALLRAQLVADVKTLAQKIRDDATEHQGLQTVLAETKRQLAIWQNEAERQKTRSTIAETEREALQTTLAELQTSPPPRMRKLKAKPAE